MENNHLCVGCTGRQRLMTKDEQDCKNEKYISISNIIRKIQFTDYEITFAVHTTAFSFIGYLPVLPGPCALFRYSSLIHKHKIRDIDPLEILLSSSPISDQESPMEHFTSLVTIPINTTNIIIENIKLAEDRIPSYSIITHGNKNVYTTCVNGAIFKSQAEINLKTCIFQRRRWINGSFMCNIWNLFIKKEYIK